MVLNRDFLTLFEILIRHCRGLSVLVCVWIRFSFLFFSKGKNEIGRIDMQDKVEACISTQAVDWLERQLFLREKGYSKVDDIIDDANSLTLDGVRIM